jgi:hypothetical protein
LKTSLWTPSECRAMRPSSSICSHFTKKSRSLLHIIQSLKVSRQAAVAQSTKPPWDGPRPREGEARASIINQRAPSYTSEEDSCRFFVGYTLHEPCQLSGWGRPCPEREILNCCEPVTQTARAKPESRARSASCEGKARAHLLPRPGRARLPRPLGLHAAAPIVKFVCGSPDS